MIYVDADACPVKPEILKVAERLNMEVTFVANSGLRPSRDPMVRNVIVSNAFDAADNWIADRITAADIAVTADIPLASRCLAKGATVLRHNGNPFTPEGIGMALGMRELSRHLREVTGKETHHAGFGKQDRSRFLGALENAIQAKKRAG